MKKMLIFVMLLLIMIMPVYASEVKGFVFQNTKEFVAGLNIKPAERTGKSTCMEFFTIVATGDCSVSKAMANGNIQSLSHADRHIVNVLGVRRVIVHAYGE